MVNTVCENCPWRRSSPRFTLSVEYIHDLRFEELHPEAEQLKLCKHTPELSSSQCGGFPLPTKALSLLELGLSRFTQLLGGVRSSQPESEYFTHFEEMAEANGAGLPDWTKQLLKGSQVVHFPMGLHGEFTLDYRIDKGNVVFGKTKTNITLLEVDSFKNSFLYTLTNREIKKFDGKGYQVGTLVDSRILPATRATLALITRYI